ncbi:hypothetical protein, variant 2 [Blastomyces gilchristii SLH14081]|uniref:DUF7053 domain-containing protein n=1 Tax=Blastomyces gilchristii (strain SLH14081) TaxID=559298 RepID=A0A179V3A6_BLAGS|nr:hypothetical protein, variant 2 [Blastomyces gilchristii SLH14081]XP_031580707.1 uncharacterized protein BDBG_08361 [Blastomyces gilchristii SLH14081]XP_031580708.1 hypothetical protein, variant 1 [Blastomyces gilchristii SLH14081]OAT13091.1 hypothetical protein BDBG_08361 [Blastomyces gilchristii SLH14081]OAT13092.1 hypothetical protein, variant 1 [Blastomyces gilchristii SLH14081]OAT13093.1 hypothetical protein, variant 2 [Blastomyces gilchristii SLH14081]
MRRRKKKTMFKRIIFTTVTPLPPHIPRNIVIETLHAHNEMIELNPLVIRHGRCKAPPNAPPDEFHCTWYQLTDKIHYLPGGIIRGNVTYKACFHDLPRGLQTHIYAPTGLDIRNRWAVCGNMPGEPREPVELGLTNVPREGLFLREDVDMRCNIFAASFVKKTLKEAHAVLVERLIMKADLLKGNSDTLYSPLPSPQQQHSLYLNQICSSADGSHTSAPCLSLCPSPVCPQPSMSVAGATTPTAAYPSPAFPPVRPATAIDTSPSLGYFGGGPVHYPTSPLLTYYPHSPVSPIQVGCHPFDQGLASTQPVELDSAELQPARAKAYAAATAAAATAARRAADSNFIMVTPPSPPPHIHELE